MNEPGLFAISRLLKSAVLSTPSVMGPAPPFQLAALPQLPEAFPPAEANDILKKYAEAYAQGMNIVNLNLTADLGK